MNNILNFLLKIKPVQKFIRKTFGYVTAGMITGDADPCWENEVMAVEENRLVKE